MNKLALLQMIEYALAITPARYVRMITDVTRDETEHQTLDGIMDEHQLIITTLDETDKVQTWVVTAEETDPVE